MVFFASAFLINMELLILQVTVVHWSGALEPGITKGCPNAAVQADGEQHHFLSPWWSILMTRLLYESLDQRSGINMHRNPRPMFFQQKGREQWPMHQ